MKKEQKICFRVTARRMIFTTLVATSILNLVIVGAAFGSSYSAATHTPSFMPTTLVPTTFIVPTFTMWETLTLTPIFTDTSTPTPSATPTNTFTQTPTATSTYTSTPTDTPTFSPIPCIPQYSWPIYFAQEGDTLSALALAINSTVEALMLANCLPNDQIYVGQRLFVQHLPIKTPTATYTSTTLPLTCAEFEDLKSGMDFRVGETVFTSGVSFTVAPFVWSNGTPTVDGFAYTTAEGAAGGFGLDLQINNVNLTFNLRTPPSSLSLLFGEYGGNLNLNINGDFRSFDNFADVNWLDIGGVKVDVLQGYGNDIGYLQLTGAIRSFAVGGQELWIDNVCLADQEYSS